MSNYHKKQLAYILLPGGTIPEYGIKIQIFTDLGKTNHMNLSPETFAKIAKILEKMEN